LILTAAEVRNCFAAAAVKTTKSSYVLFVLYLFVMQKKKSKSRSMLTKQLEALTVIWSVKRI
jgi:hypothetical protein